MAKVMLNSKKDPKNLWAEVVNTTCYVSNRVFSRPSTKQTSYELWKGKKLNVGYFYTFGSKCYILNEGVRTRNQLAVGTQGYGSRSGRVLNFFNAIIN